VQNFKASGTPRRFYRRMLDGEVGEMDIQSAHSPKGWTASTSSADGALSHNFFNLADTGDSSAEATEITTIMIKFCAQPKRSPSYRALRLPLQKSQWIEHFFVR
jgi:hypothetical protein